MPNLWIDYWREQGERGELPAEGSEEAARLAALEERFGSDTLCAEQSLSGSQPWHLENRLQRLARLRSRRYHRLGDLPWRFRPEAGRAFALPSRWLSEPEARLFSVPGYYPGASEPFRRSDGGVTRIRCFVHPAEATQSAESSGWWGTPSASARSFFALKTRERDPLVLKLSLDRTMMGFSRRLGADQIVRGVTVSHLVDEAHRASGGKLPGGGKWAHFPEVFGCVPGTGPGGYLVRRFPEGLDPEQYLFLPYLALLSERSPRTWIEELKRASGLASMEDFLWQALLQPVLELFELLALGHGLTAELHRQNLTLAVDRASLEIVAVCVRDMDGIGVDAPLRRSLGLGEAPEPPDWAREAKRDTLNTKEAQLAQAFYVDYLVTMTVEPLAKGLLPATRWPRVVERAYRGYLDALSHRLGRRVAKPHQLPRFWEAYHRELSPETQAPGHLWRKVRAYSLYRRAELALERAMAPVKAVLARSLGQSRREDEAVVALPVGYGRLAGLDGLRGFAMLLGIVLHSAIAYMHYPLPTWPVRDAHSSLAADTLVYAIHSFRMQLFFVLAGFFATLLITHRGLSSFLRHRWKRIGIPFLASLLLIQPQLQAISLYRERVEQRSVRAGEIPPPSFREYFYPISPEEPVPPPGEALRSHFASGSFLRCITPMHLWFLYYLGLLYALHLLLAPLLDRFLTMEWLTRAGPLGLAVATVPFLYPMRTWAVDSASGWQPQAKILAYYFLFFFAGAIAFRRPRLFSLWARGWKAKLLVANLLVLPLAGGLTVWGLPTELTQPPAALPAWFPLLKLGALLAQALYTWLMVQGMLGLALQSWSRHARLSRYVADMSYWCYLMSLAPVTLLQIALEGQPWPWPVKLAAVAVTSLAFLVGSYQLFVRYSFIGEALHGKRVRR